MEEKRSILDYLAQVLLIFGFTMAVINLFCLTFGASAKGFSAMFALGNEGIPVEVVFQFFMIAICGSPLCIFYGRPDPENGALAADSVYDDRNRYHNSRICSSIPLVSGHHVAALGNVSSLLWNLRFGRVSGNG